MSEANVSDLMGKYTKLYGFVASHISDLIWDICNTEAKQRNITSQIYKDRPAITNFAKHQQATIVNTDTRIVKLQDKIRQLEAEKDLAQTYLMTYDKYASTLSRELTRRTKSNTYGNS